MRSRPARSRRRSPRGSLLFSDTISSGKFSHVELAFLIGAAVMVIGGLAEVFLGVKAEGQSLENIAKRSPPGTP